MKITGLKLKPYVTDLKVVCDNCGEECTKWHFDINIKDCHGERIGLLETVCFDCYDKKYRQKIYEHEKKQNDFTSKNMAEIRRSIDVLEE